MKKYLTLILVGLMATFSVYGSYKLAFGLEPNCASGIQGFTGMSCPSGASVPTSSQTPGVVAVATASTASASCQVNVPTGTQNGNVMIAQFSGGSTAAATNETATMTGWTIDTNSTFNGTTGAGGGFVHTWIAWRKAASEPASYTFTMSPTTNVNSQCGIITMAGINSTTPIDASTNRSVDGGTTDILPACPTVTPTASNDFLLCFMSWTNLANVFTNPSATPTLTQQWKVTVDRQPIWLGEVGLSSSAATATYQGGFGTGDYDTASTVALKQGS